MAGADPDTGAQSRPGHGQRQTASEPRLLPQVCATSAGARLSTSCYSNVAMRAYATSDIIWVTTS
jgi:hypothetical protein